MKLKLDSMILYLGKVRKDGYRNIERVRLLDNRMLLSKLREAKIPAQMIGTRLIGGRDRDIAEFWRYLAILGKCRIGYVFGKSSLFCPVTIEPGIFPVSPPTHIPTYASIQEFRPYKVGQIKADENQRGRYNTPTWRGKP